MFGSKKCQGKMSRRPQPQMQLSGARGANLPTTNAVADGRHGAPQLHLLVPFRINKGFSACCPTVLNRSAKLDGVPDQTLDTHAIEPIDLLDTGG